MMCFNKIILFICSFFSFCGVSYACSTVSQNYPVELITYGGSGVCFNLKNISQNSYILIDSSIQKNAAFTASVKTPNGQTLLNQNFSYSTGVFNAYKKLTGLYSGSELNIVLSPATSYRKYTFTAVHDYNQYDDISVIYISLKSEVYGSNTPPNGGGVNPRSMDTFAFSNTLASSSTSSNNLGEATQCTDSNRPPSSLAVDKNGNSFNLNSMLRTTSGMASTIASTFNPSSPDGIAGNTMMLMRAAMLHRVGGQLDFSHNPPVYEGSTRIGNFVYGANLRAMGYSTSQILSISAGIDAITDKNYNWHQKITNGAYNHFTGSGEEIQDVEDVMSGIKYYDEVFSQNSSDLSVSSCIDAESIDSHQEVADESNNSTGSGGDNAGTPTTGNVYVPGGGGGGGVEWCFVNSGGVVLFCWMA